MTQPASPTFFDRNDPMRFLPSIEQVEKMKTKAEVGNFNKLQRVVSALSVQNYSRLFSSEAKQCSLSLLPLCYQGIVQQKLPLQAVLKVIGIFASCGVFEAISEDIVCKGSDGGSIQCNKDLLMLNSPVLQKFLQPGFKEGANKEIYLPEISLKILRYFKHYLYCQNVQTSLCIEDYASLYKIGHQYEMKNLCRQCLECVKSIVCDVEDAESLAEVFYNFLRTIAEMIEEKESEPLIASFVKAVFEQKKMPHKVLSNGMLAIPISNAYLLNKDSPFAELLKTCVGGLYIRKIGEDEEYIEDLLSLSPKVKQMIEYLNVQQEISSERLKSLVKRLPALNNICISVAFSTSREQLEIVASAEKLTRLRLNVPDLHPQTDLKAEKNRRGPFGSFPMQALHFPPFDYAVGGFDERIEELLGVVMPKPEPTVTYLPNECLFQTPKTIALLQRLSMFTVSGPCAMVFPKSVATDIERITGILKAKFISTLTIKLPSNYSNLLVLTPFKEEVLRR